MNPKQIDRLINELLDLEALGKQVQQRSYSARKLLESVYSPASKGPKKEVVSEAELRKLSIQMRNRRLKPCKASNNRL